MHLEDLFPCRGSFWRVLTRIAGKKDNGKFRCTCCWSSCHVPCFKIRGYLPSSLQSSIWEDIPQCLQSKINPQTGGRVLETFWISIWLRDTLRHLSNLHDTCKATPSYKHQLWDQPDEFQEDRRTEPASDPNDDSKCELHRLFEHNARLLLYLSRLHHAPAGAKLGRVKGLLLLRIQAIIWATCQRDRTFWAKMCCSKRSKPPEQKGCERTRGENNRVLQNLRLLALRP